MSQNYDKLQRLLEELFQLDQADLDFGIYRIMNQKRDEIVRFLEKDLLPQVKTAFGKYQSADRVELQQELDKAVQSATDLGVDPDSIDKVKALRGQLADAAVDVTALENEVFSHLYNFFRRYYSEGDFISQRRYKEGVYAIPYEGEEVKLHWANHDQYYVKSSEHFRDYTFKLPFGRRVHARLVAASTEQDNKKEQTGKERRFILCEEKPLMEENGALLLRFEFRPDSEKRKQDALTKEACQRILNATGFDEWIKELSQPVPTKANPERTLLEKHLAQYTARNTFDYFIHKDLGGFLKRELDFYIKNEVMHLDDIEEESVPRVEQYLSKIKVIRQIAHKIIQFLAQLENFQKKLWLKKKFVVETNYCITLDRVPEELYPEIAANDAQREEWVRLFAIDEIEQDLSQPGYSEPLTVEFLKANPFLVVDTFFFTSSFRDKLLAGFSSLNDSCMGIVSQGDNFHFLSLLKPSFNEQVKAIYIDPPYNTGSDGFVYKDGYEDSSWISMIKDRIQLAYSILVDSGALVVSIDDNESHLLKQILLSIFGKNNAIADIAWQKRYAPDIRKAISDAHEYLFFFSKNPTEFKNTRNKLPLTEAQTKQFSNPDNDPRGPWKADNFTGQGFRPNQMYEITTPTGRVVTPPEGRCWVFTEEKYKALVKDKRMYFGRKGEGMPAVKRFLKDMDGLVPWTWWSYKDVGHSQDGMKESMALFGRGGGFVTAKPEKLLDRIINICSNPNDWVLDFFAGSGTTGHAVIRQSRKDGNRKFLLAEMAEYFDVVVLPRLKKAIYSDQWNDGKPVDRDGVSHCFKYIRLESYEDALNNLELQRTPQQELQLEADDELREQYTLSYMLDVESRGSQSLLNVESFRNPDAYQLKVERDGETQLVNVDLVETFNWLLGLTVRHIDVIRGVRVVEGTTPDGERTLVLWRKLDETDNDALDEWFRKQNYNTRDQEFDLIYVNGDNNLENLRRNDQTWKVRLTEEEFGRLMFEVEDV